RASSANSHSVGGKIRDVETLGQRPNYPIRRSGDEHRLKAHATIRFDEFEALRIEMIDEQALAVLPAQLGQAVARDSLERLEHQDVELASILLLREIQARSPGGEARDVAQAIAPLAEVGEHEQGDVDKIEIDQGSIEIVERG